MYYFITLHPQLDDVRNTVCPDHICVSTSPRVVLYILYILKSTSFLDKNVFYVILKLSIGLRVLSQKRNKYNEDMSGNNMSGNDSGQCPW